MGAVPPVLLCTQTPVGTGMGAVPPGLLCTETPLGTGMGVVVPGLLCTETLLGTEGGWEQVHWSALPECQAGSGQGQAQFGSE